MKTSIPKHAFPLNDVFLENSKVLVLRIRNDSTYKAGLAGIQNLENIYFYIQTLNLVILLFYYQLK